MTTPTPTTSEASSSSAAVTPSPVPAVSLTEEEMAQKKKKEEARKAAKAAKLAKFEAKKEKEKVASSTKKKEETPKPEETTTTSTSPACEDPTTPAGEKKQMNPEMANAYHPMAVEKAWYEWWEKQGFFKPECDTASTTGQPTGNKFVIMIPPPNVTGSLHLGHALTNSIQDSLVRWHRMRGDETLWVPGTDHAGISTQVVVEKKLARERNGLSRHDLGREAFVAEVWKWKQEYGGHIVNQLRRIGSSVDWDRECFTMDEVRSKAVTEAFVRLHDKGLIYRANRLVNWCCTLRTAISDIEVEYKELTGPTKMKVPGHGDKLYPFGELVHFAYKIADCAEDDPVKEVVVATTRLETMLADACVAIHPDDQRYQSLHGKSVVHPFTGKKLPIICDSTLVDMAFGTGCVKVTPAHDPNDYECALRHHLPLVNMLNPNGTLNDVCGPKFSGMKRFDARLEVLKELKAMGLYRDTTPNPMTIGLCSRSKDIIEPMLKPQWYVNCGQAAKESCAAVRDGRIEIVPKQFEGDWFRWLENIRDWCVSRQLWWGHRIPAYHCSIKGQPADDNSWVTGRNEEEARARAAVKLGCAESEVTLEQDPDVLDTWFSSGLFPFATMGWPENTLDLEKYFPGSLLETGYDILFFWVARMVMMSLMLTGKVPFHHVMLHAMVRDAHGRKMSKTLGNVIDPIDVIQGITLDQLHEKLLHGNLAVEEVEKAKQGQKADFPDGIAECGTDAMRFALCAYTSQARDVNLDIKRVVGYRNFCNKLWNACKFSMSKLGASFHPAATPIPTAEFLASPHTSSMDRWVLSRLAHAVRETNRGFESYDLSLSTSALFAFWQDELCPVYLEAVKPVFLGSDEAAKEAARETLYTCVETGIRLLHPFMPFVTEELWQRLPRRHFPAASKQPDSIMVAAYPLFTTRYEALINANVENEVAMIMAVVKAIRTANSPYDPDIKKSGKKLKVFVRPHTAHLAALLHHYNQTVQTLSLYAESIIVMGDSSQTTPVGCAMELAVVMDGNEQSTAEVFSELKGIVNAEVELAKLSKKRSKMELEMTALVAKTTDQFWETKTPEEIKLATKEKMAALTKELALATSTAAFLASMK